MITADPQHLTITPVGNPLTGMTKVTKAWEVFLKKLYMDRYEGELVAKIGRADGLDEKKGSRFKFCKRQRIVSKGFYAYNGRTDSSGSRRDWQGHYYSPQTPDEGFGD